MYCITHQYIFHKKVRVHYNGEIINFYSEMGEYEINWTQILLRPLLLRPLFLRRSNLPPHPLLPSISICIPPPPRAAV